MGEGMRYLCSALLAVLFAGVSYGQSIPPESVAAYLKIGARFEAARDLQKLNDCFTPETQRKGTSLAGFAFLKFPKAAIPDVPVPFTLDLSASDVRDADLKK